MGEEVLDSNKLWIHEIAPSRTEIRVLPIRANKKNEDLEKRYSVFTNGDTFRDDVIYYVEKFIESFDIQKIISTFLFSKGTESDGKAYINKIKQEFKIENFDIFMNQIEKTLVESMKYYANKRVWNINDINYGKPTEEQDCIELSVKKLKEDTITALINSIDFNLPKRTIQDNSVLTKEEQITLDKVKQILKSSTSDSVYETTVLETVVRGCTDPKAVNFNEAATINDGSCEYIDRIVVKGCMNPKATNYNPSATEDDGSCTFESNLETKKYYIWSEIAQFQYRDEFDVVQTINGMEYDAFTVVYKCDSFTVNAGDVREIPKMPQNSDAWYHIIRNNHDFSIDSYSPAIGGGAVTYTDASGNFAFSSNIGPGEQTTICAKENSIFGPYYLTWTKGGQCIQTGNSSNSGTSSGGGSSSGGGGREIIPLDMPGGGGLVNPDNEVYIDEAIR